MSPKSIEDHPPRPDLAEESEDEASALEGVPLSYQITALVCAILLSAGSHFTVHSLNSLKTTLKAEIPIDNAQYGALQSTNSLMNSIIPLFGGVLLDRFGTGVGSLACTGTIVLGTLLTAIASVVRSYPLMLFSRVLFGLGSGTIVVAQESILSNWFRGKGLAVTIGLQIASSRLFGFLAHAGGIPIRNATGFYGSILWVAFGLCTASFLLNILYVTVLKRALKNREAVKKGPRKVFSARAMLRVPGTFWLIPLSIGMFSAVWMPFLSFATEYVQFRWGTTDLISAWTSSISLAVPIILSPFCGYFFDRYGRRGPVVLFSAAILVVAMVLLGWSMASPIIGLTLFSLSLTLAPVALVTSVSLVLPASLVGTGLGIYKCAHSSAIAFIDIVVGAVQDADNGSYERVIPLLLAFALASCFCAIAYWVADRVFLNGLFNVDGADRPDVVAAHRAEQEGKGADGPINITSIIGTVAMFSFFILCWITYGIHVTR